MNFRSNTITTRFSVQEWSASIHVLAHAHGLQWPLQGRSPFLLQLTVGCDVGVHYPVLSYFALIYRHRGCRLQWSPTDNMMEESFKSNSCSVPNQVAIAVKHKRPASLFFITQELESRPRSSTQRLPPPSGFSVRFWRGVGGKRKWRISRALLGAFSVRKRASPATRRGAKGPDESWSKILISRNSPFLVRGW